MKKNYSNQKSISVATQKIGTNTKKIINASLPLKSSAVLQSGAPFTNYDHRLQNSKSAVNLQPIYTIINIHYPTYFSSTSQNNFPLTAEDVTYKNYQQILNNFCKTIKNQHAKQIQKIQNKLNNMQIQLKKIKDCNIDNQSKIKILQKDIKQKQEKLKCKQLDCYSKNEEIFKIKQRNEVLEKRIVVQNIEIQQIYSQFEKFKKQAYTQLTKYQTINKKINATNLRNEQKILNLQRKIKNLQQQHQKQIIHLRQIINTHELNNSKFIQYQQILQQQQAQQQHTQQAQQVQQAPQIIEYSQTPITQQYTFNFQQQSEPKYKQHRKNNSIFRSDFLTNNQPSNTAESSMIRTRSNSASNFNISRSRVAQRSQKILSNSELMSQIIQLRNNQSALLDRLAQRDQHIEILQKQLLTPNNILLQQ